MTWNKYIQSAIQYAKYLQYKFEEKLLDKLCANLQYVECKQDKWFNIANSAEQCNRWRDEDGIFALPIWQAGF